MYIEGVYVGVHDLARSSWQEVKNIVQETRQEWKREIRKFLSVAGRR